MDRDIYLIPFRLELGFAFRADIRLGNHNEIQSNKQNKYRNNYKIPRDIEMATKPINLTRRKHEGGKKQKQRNKYFFHYSTAFLSFDACVKYIIAHFGEDCKRKMKHSLREYEAQAVGLHEAARCAVKRSAMLLLREPKARFIGRSPASFFMRISALHFQKEKHFLRSAFCFEVS